MESYSYTAKVVLVIKSSSILLHWRQFRQSAGEYWIRVSINQVRNNVTTTVLDLLGLVYVKQCCEAVWVPGSVAEPILVQICQALGVHIVESSNFQAAPNRQRWKFAARRDGGLKMHSDRMGRYYRVLDHATLVNPLAIKSKDLVWNSWLYICHPFMWSCQ